MSTGAPVSGVDTLPPPSHGHGHKHARGRGHSRSTGPISHSISISDLNPAQQSVAPTLNGPGHSNGSVPEPRLGHHHSHSHTSNHGDGLHTHAAKHSHSGSVTGLVSDMHVPSPDVGLWNRSEISASLLLALPWTALSWYYKHHADAALSHTTATEEGSSALDTPHVDGIASRTCTLTALTMIIFGVGQLLRPGGSAVVASPKVDANMAKGALLRALSIALPIYAALKVGGFLVAFTMLLAMASGVPTITSGSMPASGQTQFSQKKLTVGFIVTVIVLNYLGLSPSMESRPLIGYVALLCSIFLARPPFSGQTPSSIAVPGLGISGPGIPTPQQKSSSMASPVVSSEESVVIAFAGLLLGITTFIFGSISVGASHALHLLSVAGALAACITYVVPTDIRSPQKLGMAISTGGAALLCAPPLQSGVQVAYLFRCMLSAIGFFVARFDDSHSRLGAHTHTHHSHHDSDASRVSKLIIRYSEPYPLLYSIVKESDSRKIFYFMSLNFAFMLVQLSYGFLTGSLGLLSDSIHMFFDCLALVVGLCAAVMSKWPPSARFPYGYGKVDTLSGFANGIFLMIISIEIIYEAVERLSTGSQVHRIGELLLVSIAGLGVNLVGIMAFEHGHGHGHGHDHHGHSHSHGNENMHGIFLHILADTLGSVAVVISTVLVHYSGWPGYDPIASCLIAILIFASAVPLVSSTAKSLLLTLPADVEYNVRDTLAGVCTLRGVVGYTVPKFWLDDTASSSEHDHHDHGCSHDHGHSHSHGHGHGHGHGHNDSHSHSHSHSHDHHDHGHDHDHDHDHAKSSRDVLGVIHVIAGRGADLEDVRQRTVDFLREKGMDILVQVEREGDGRCWCGGGNKTS